MMQYVADNGIEDAVTHFTGIEAGTRMFDEIVKDYNELKEGK